VIKHGFSFVHLRSSRIALGVLTSGEREGAVAVRAR
jgi:hypothetical protein